MKNNKAITCYILVAAFVLAFATMALSDATIVPTVTILVEPTLELDAADIFNADGLMRVMVDGLYGFVNANGEYVAPPVYNYAGLIFTDGMCRVTKDGKSGFINLEGELVVPCIYDYAEDFNEGRAAVRDVDGNWGHIDKKGNIVTPFNYARTYSYKNGYALVWEGEGWLGLYGYVDMDGNEIIPCIYEMAYDFYEGLAIVGDWDNQMFIDETGTHVLTNLDYDQLCSFSEGLAAVGYTDYDDYTTIWGYINLNGELVIPMTIEGSAGEFHNGFAIVSDSNYRPAVIDTKGNFIIPYGFDDIMGVENGYAIVSTGWSFEDRRFGVYNDSGEEILPCEYRSLTEISEGIIGALDISYKWGYLDIETGDVVVPFEYDDAYRFADGHAVVRQGEKYGMINKNSEVTIPFEYEAMDTWLSNGVIAAEKNGIWGIIDASNNVMLPFEYDAIGNFNFGLSWIMNSDGLYGIVQSAWGVEPNPSPEETPTPSPEETPTPSPEETPTPSPEETPTPSPEETPTPSPEETPTPSLEPAVYIVTFLDKNGEIIEEVEVVEGEDAIPPEAPEYDYYLFYEWDGDYTNVTENRDVTAIYMMLGDANMDSDVNTGDAVLILKYCVDTSVLTEYTVKLANINRDNLTNTGDAAMILQIMVELLTKPW